MLLKAFSHFLAVDNIDVCSCSLFSFGSPIVYENGGCM